MLSSWHLMSWSTEWTFNPEFFLWRLTAGCHKNWEPWSEFLNHWSQKQTPTHFTETMIPLLIAIVEILGVVWFTWGVACCNCDNHSYDPSAQGTVSLEHGSGWLRVVIQAVGRQLWNTNPINCTIREQNAKYFLLKVCFRNSASYINVLLVRKKDTTYL